MDAKNLIPESGLQAAVLYREEGLDAAIEIARHQVGAADEHLFVTAVVEIVDPGMLEKASHDGRHLDVLTHPGDARTEAADATGLQLDFHPSLRCAVQRPDEVLVHQSIHLEGYIAVAVLFVLLNLPVDAGNQLLLHLPRSNQQLAVLVLAGIARQSIEQIGKISTELGVTGEIAQVRVDTSRDVIVVPCGHVDVPADPFALVPHHQTDFGVRLEPHQTVDHVHSGLLQ